MVLVRYQSEKIIMAQDLLL